MPDEHVSLADVLEGLTPDEAMQVIDEAAPAIREVRERITGAGAKAQAALMAEYKTAMAALMARGAGVHERLILRQSFRQRGLHNL